MFRAGDWVLRPEYHYMGQVTCSLILGSPLLHLSSRTRALTEQGGSDWV